MDPQAHQAQKDQGLVLFIKCYSVQYPILRIGKRSSFFLKFAVRNINKYKCMVLLLQGRNGMNGERGLTGLPGMKVISSDGKTFNK